jgi:hypothetical protein
MIDSSQFSLQRRKNVFLMATAPGAMFLTRPVPRNAYQHGLFISRVDSTALNKSVLFHSLQYRHSLHFM